MSIEDNKNLLLYARSLWKKHNKFIPFPYVISNEKDILKKSEDVIPCLLNKEAFEINLYLLKRYIKEYPQKQLFRLWGDGVNIGGLNKVLSLSSEEKSGVLISKEGMRRADKFLHLSALVIHKYLTNYDYYLFREGADEIGGIIICENFIDCKDIVKGINNQIYKYSQMLQLSSVPHTKYPNRYGSMFVCACNPITKNFQREKNIEDTVKVYCSQYSPCNNLIKYDDEFVFRYEKKIQILLNNNQIDLSKKLYKNNDNTLYKKISEYVFNTDIKSSNSLDNRLLKGLKSDDFIVALQQNNMKGLNEKYGHNRADRIHNILASRVLMEIQKQTKAEG